MAGLFEDILTNLQEKKQEGKISGGYRYKDGKLNIGGGYYGDDSMFEVDVNKDGGNILFKKRFADGGSTNGSAEKAFSAKVKELMDDGYDFGEAVKEAMRQGYAKGGRINFDSGGSPLQKLKQEIVESMRPYAPGVPENKLQIIVKDITFDMSPEEAQASAVSNFQKLFGMASGGRVGYKKGGLSEEYYGKDQLDWMENFKDQMTFEEYLRYKRSGSFASGGRVALYKGGDPELQKLYQQLVKKQSKRSIKLIGWNQTKLTNLKNYLDASGKTLSQYLEMTPSDRNKVNKAELKGVGKGVGQADVPSVKAFKKWLAKQNPLTLKADNLQELVKKAKIPSVRMGKGSRLVGIPMARIAQIMEENPQFTGVKKRDWKTMQVQDKKTSKHLGKDNPKYSGVYETTSKTGSKSYYAIVQRDNKEFKKAVNSPDEGAKFVKQNRKLPTVKEKAGEVTLEERERFKKENINQKKLKETDTKRNEALKKRSSFAFEDATKGDIKTVGGHTGSIYAEDVTPETKKYTPTKINQVLENYDNVLNNITKKRDAAIAAGNAAEVERLNTKGMKYASLTQGFKTFTVKQIDGTGFVFGQTSRAGLADPGGFMKPGMTAKEVTTFGTAYGGSNAPVMRAKFIYKNALEKQEGIKIKINELDKYSPKTAEAITAKNNLTRINKIEAAKLFDEGTNKALINFQKEDSKKSIAMNKKTEAKVSNQILNDFKKVSKLEKNLKVPSGFIVNRLNSGIPMDEILNLISKNSNVSLSAITSKAMTALKGIGEVDYSKMQLGSGKLATAAGVVKNASKILGKAVGVAAVPLTAYELRNMYKQGKTKAEMLAYPFFLDSMVGETQDLLKMTKPERQAIKNEQIAEDFSMMDSDFYTPPLKGVEAVNTQMVKDRVAQERALEEEKRKNLRNKTLPNEGLLRILSNPTYEGVL